MADPSVSSVSSASSVLTTARLAERMGAAVFFGAALSAACQSEAEPSADGGAGGAGGMPGPAYPSAPAPGECPGEPESDAEALAGPCCERVECYDPAEGEPCPDAFEFTQDNAIAEALGHSGLGSGECLCGVEGPWDPTSARAYTEESGRCCYTIAIQWCTGRPLMVAGVARVAPLVARADWT
jgi:hypothetical protein